MTVLLLDSTTLAKIAMVNASGVRDQLTPETLTDGRSFLSADIQTDCGPGGTWAAWGSIILPITPTVVDDSLIRPPIKQV